MTKRLGLLLLAAITTACGDFVFLFLETPRLSNGVDRVEAIPYLPLGHAFTMKAGVTGLESYNKNGVLGVAA